MGNVSGIIQSVLCRNSLGCWKLNSRFYYKHDFQDLKKESGEKKKKTLE